MTLSREDTGRVTVATITDAQIRELFYADEIAAIELTVAPLPGWRHPDGKLYQFEVAYLFSRFAKDCKVGEELRSGVEFPDDVAKGALPLKIREEKL